MKDLLYSPKNENRMLMHYHALQWSRKSRPLHAKGLEQVLNWLQKIQVHYGGLQEEASSVL